VGNPGHVTNRKSMIKTKSRKSLIQPAPPPSKDPVVARLNEAVTMIINSGRAKDKREVAAPVYGYNGFSAMLSGNRTITPKFLSAFISAWNLPDGYFDELPNLQPLNLDGSRIYHVPATRLHELTELKDTGFIKSLDCWSLPGLKGIYYSLVIDVKTADTDLPTGGIAICDILEDLEKIMLERMYVVGVKEGVFFGKVSSVNKGIIHLGGRKIPAEKVLYSFHILTVVPPVFN
jgi:hypothetical protein